MIVEKNIGNNFKILYYYYLKKRVVQRNVWKIPHSFLFKTGLIGLWLT